MTRIEISDATHNALENLFTILAIEGENFDEKLFELASRAFSANADLDKDRQTLRERSPAGRPKGRKRMEIKEDTYWRLRELHGKLFPYLPWTSWSWYLNELANIAEDGMHDGRQELHFSKDEG